MAFFGNGIKVPDYLGQMRGFAEAPIQQAPKKGGFFKKGGAGRAIVGYIGDALAGNNAYAEGVSQEREATLKEQLAARRREEEYEDKVRWAEWEAANKGPDTPATAKEVNYYRSIGRHDIADDIEAKHRLAMVQRVGPGDSIISEYVRPSQMMGGQGGGSHLDATPTVEDGHIYTPGPGGRANQSNWKTLGGASQSNGSGGFPRY